MEWSLQSIQLSSRTPNFNLRLMCACIGWGRSRFPTGFSYRTTHWIVARVTSVNTVWLPQYSSESANDVTCRLQVGVKKLFSVKSWSVLWILPFSSLSIEGVSSLGRDVGQTKNAKPVYHVAQWHHLSAQLLTCGMVVLTLAGNTLKYHNRTSVFKPLRV